MMTILVTLNIAGEPLPRAERDLVAPILGGHNLEVGHSPKEGRKGAGRSLEPKRYESNLSPYRRCTPFLLDRKNVRMGS